MADHGHAIIGEKSTFVRCCSRQYQETSKVVVMIKRFSEWIELVLVSKEISHHTTVALRGVLEKEWSTRKGFNRSRRRVSG
jgi:hypothetical protein